ITPARFKESAALIAKTFPTESEYSYYVPYRYDSVIKTKLLTKGKLFTRYNNVYRSRILSSGGIVRNKIGTKRKREEQVVDRVQLAFNANLLSDITDDEFQEKDNGLKENIDPWTKVIKFWSDTSKRRIYNLISDTSITTYINSYPVLKHVT
ncbi:GSCOCG00010983001-RA-CDS, partial [Cotesia congregata]